MRALEAEVDLAARSDAKVLITGETGVGKEVIAKLVHRRSRRAPANLVTLNCAGLPDSLLESELFGHMRGSFTGAYRDKPGLLELAADGTVFLDEIGEMPARMQAVLLRFLETGEIQRVGADRVNSHVDVRLITATNRNLESEVAAGGFREDLFFRLNVVRLSIPSLRERIEDIEPLVDYYVSVYSEAHRMPATDVAPDAMEVLLAYHWPGNVRELRNVVERAVLKAGGRRICPASLPGDVTQPKAVHAEADTAPPPSVVETLTDAMLNRGESFWEAVYPQFMARDLTRTDLRQVVQTGLEATRGNYRSLVQLFNMPDADYKRFLSFLHKHDCRLPFQRYRAAPRRRTDEKG